MVRLLFWIAVIAAAIWLWRKFKSAPVAKPDKSLDSPLKMVRCAHCGLHVPDTQAIRTGSLWYCSQKHLEQGPRER
ncbi:PP0621 family protein [Pseudomonas sp. R5(2019)]|uniref:PP0621 family protein n=1 Tax=Pseudomonas sp. R5(2019) TaxID=2697566 RepID=UPI0014127ADF|nr:PP0621 family protein [Pseudomonas sp. R5(2019)]NBA96430.1 hypothetical protein [Pseudomonas sp. R5(2019)]